jgi:glycosyltransferase involved in cell wall biosynthesis
MRIAVFENLPPGGALRAAYEIGRGLAERGHELHLFRLDIPEDKGPFDLAPMSASVHTTPFRPLFGLLHERMRRLKLAPRSYTLFGPLRRAHRKLAQAIRGGSYDVVLLHQDALTTGAPYVLRWLDGLPTVFYCQEPPRFASERSILQQHRKHLARPPRVIGWLRLLEDNLVLGRQAQADYENSRYARRVLVNSVYSRERVWASYGRNATVCYLGIDGHRFAPAPGQTERRREVLSVGLPITAKGHDMVVEALARLPAEVRPAMRLIIPRQDGTAYLKNLAASLGVALTVEVSVDEDKFVECYRSSMATICAAHLEPFGLTPIESMACGTPVVAFREGGFRESVTDGATGILVEPEIDSLAEGIRRLAGDPDLVNEMGARGREEVVSRWTWARTWDQVEQVLETESKRG